MMPHSKCLRCKLAGFCSLAYNQSVLPVLVAGAASGVNVKNKTLLSKSYSCKCDVAQKGTTWWCSKSRIKRSKTGAVLEMLWLRWYLPTNSEHKCERDFASQIIWREAAHSKPGGGKRRRRGQRGSGRGGKKEAAWCVWRRFDFLKALQISVI